MGKIWFPELGIFDNTAAAQGESEWSWLNRSTTPSAQAARRFLNDNLAALQMTPDEERNLVSRLKAHWRSAYFELIVGRTMQALGGTLRFEVPTANGRRPDFLVSFPDGTVTVECISPEYDEDATQQAKHWSRLVDAMEPFVPEGWSVWVKRLPYDIKPSDKIRRFKQVIKDLLATVPPPGVDHEPYEIRGTFDDEPVILYLLPREGGDRPIRGGPAVGQWDRTRERICAAVEGKRSQVRTSTSPVVLAIEASGISSGWHHFDHALYGYSYKRVGDDSPVWEPGRFTGPSSLRYAGVLAFLDVGFVAGPEPILYTNPRFDEPLPVAFGALTHKAFTERDGIHIAHTGTGGVYDKIGFVSSSQ